MLARLVSKPEADRAARAPQPATPQRGPTGIRFAGRLEQGAVQHFGEVTAWKDSIGS
jgi:hypothetical protein